MPDTARDLIKQTISNTPGTAGSLTLSAAATGWLALGASDDGKTFTVLISASDSDTASKELRSGCTYTHSTTTLTRGTLVAGTAIDLTSSAVVSVVMQADVGNRLERAMQAVMPGGRLTLESGVPVSTTDQTAKTTIYYTPYVHDTIPLWDGKRWVPTTFAETSEALGTLTSGLEYNVFAFLNAGGLDLEKAEWATATVTFTNGTDVVNWTSTPAVDGDMFFFYGGTAPTGLANYTTYYVRDKTANSFKLAATPGGTAINFTTNGSGTITGKLQNVTLQDGRWCKNGDKTRLLLGAFYTSAATTTDDSTTLRYVSNVYNRQTRRLASAILAANSHTYVTGSWREWNAGTGVTRMQFLFALPSEAFVASLIANLTGSTITHGYINLQIDGTDGADAQKLSATNAGAYGANVVPTASFMVAPQAAGKHYMTVVEYGNSGTTFYSADMQMEVRC